LQRVGSAVAGRRHVAAFPAIEIGNDPRRIRWVASRDERDRIGANDRGSAEAQSQR